MCELACEEIEDGNFTAKDWTSQGYKNIKEKYYQKTKLWHPGREVKNKIQNLKGVYNDWVWLQQQNGCGRGLDGEVTATADWWEKEIKVFLLLLPLLQVFIFAYVPMTEDIYADFFLLFLFRTDQISRNLERVTVVEITRQMS